MCSHPSSCAGLVALVTHMYAGAYVYGGDDAFCIYVSLTYTHTHTHTNAGANVYARDDAGMTADQAAALGDRYTKCVLYRMCSLYRPEGLGGNKRLPPAYVCYTRTQTHTRSLSHTRTHTHTHNLNTIYVI